MSTDKILYAGFNQDFGKFYLSKLKFRKFSYRS